MPTAHTAGPGRQGNIIRGCLTGGPPQASIPAPPCSFKIRTVSWLASQRAGRQGNRTSSQESGSDDEHTAPIYSSHSPPCANSANPLRRWQPLRAPPPPPRPPPHGRCAACCACARSSRQRPPPPARPASPSSTATPAARSSSRSRTSTQGAPPHRTPTPPDFINWCPRIQISPVWQLRFSKVARKSQK